jgi:hypothetical protein
VALGFRDFDRPGHEGHEIKHNSMGPNEILANPNFEIPRKIIGVGSCQLFLKSDI